MPRTRRSIATTSALATRNDLSPRKSEQGTPEAKTYNSPVKNNAKKRTVSDRSPAVKSRKKTPVQGTPVRSKDAEKVGTRVEKENRTPGPTPYWKVAEERGAMSPRLTRSAKKQTRPSDSPADNSEVSKGELNFSPPDLEHVRKMELQQEKERDERLKQKRLQEGDVFFLSPGDGSAKKKSIESKNQFCLQLSPEARLPIDNTGFRPMSRASSVSSGITLNSAQVEEMQLRLHESETKFHESEKECASLKAENKMMNTYLDKMQEKFDDATAKWENKSQKYIIENAKMQGKIQSLESPELRNHKDWQAMESRVEGMSQELGDFRSEQSNKHLDSEHGMRLQEMEREIVRLRQSLVEKETRIKSQAEMHENKLAAAKKDLEQHKAMTIQLDECVNKLKEEKDVAMAGVHKQREETKSSLAEKDRREKELELKLGSFDQNASFRIHELEKQVVDIQRTLAQSEEKRLELENEIALTEDKMEKSEERNVELETKCVELLDQNQAFKEEISMLDLELEKYKTELQKLTNKVIKIESERNNMESALTISEQEFNNRENELQDKLASATFIIQNKEKGLKQITEKMTNFDARESELLHQIVLQEEVRRSLHNKVIQLSGNIRVFVRVRPCIPNEEAKAKASTSPFSFPSIFDKNTKATSSSVKVGDDLTKRFIVATEPLKDRGGLSQRRKRMKFGFDNVFSPRSNQDDVWEATEPLVQSAVDGYNVCVFAYGQTGSGKTYTMLGGGNSENRGIVAQSVKKLFEAKHMLEQTSQGMTTVEISVELLEVYNEQVKDLVSKKGATGCKSLNISVNSNEAIGNTVLPVASEDEVYSVLAIAQKRRCVKATKSNEESSRSHLICTLNFIVKNASGERKSKLHICDLAGSERLGKSQAVGSTLKETQHINKSLSTLSNVIEKLQQKSSHVPFRESKLTYLLRNSLGGDSKTLAIVCCNPLAEHYQETTCSLRFAQKLNKVELQAMGNISC